MITVKPHGGLANRLRVIDSSYQLAKDIQQPIQVLWELSPELNCAYSRLFDASADLPVLDYDGNGLFKRLNRKLIKESRKIGFSFPRGYQKYFIDDDVFEFKENDKIVDELSKMKNIYIETIHLFYEKPSSFSFFKPIQEVETKVETVKSNFTDFTYGLHIRRTDNAMSIKHSPLSEFMRIMDLQLEKEPSTCFFLATDSEEDEETLINRYGNKILTFEKELSRNSEKGVQDALVDMLLLSKTRKIFGSFYSSFSSVAAYLGGIEMVEVKKG